MSTEPRRYLSVLYLSFHRLSYPALHIHSATSIHDLLLAHGRAAQESGQVTQISFILGKVTTITMYKKHAQLHSMPTSSLPRSCFLLWGGGVPRTFSPHIYGVQYCILSADDLHASVPPAAGGSLSVLYSVAQHLPASLLCTTPHHTTPPNHNRYLYLNIPQRVQYILLETQARLYRNSSTPAVFFDRLRKKKMLAPSNDRGSIAISWRSARLRCLASSLDCIHLAAAEM